MFINEDGQVYIAKETFDAEVFKFWKKYAIEKEEHKKTKKEFEEFKKRSVLK